jgi:hypothetical protein
MLVVETRERESRTRSSPEAETGEAAVGAATGWVKPDEDGGTAR